MVQFQTIASLDGISIPLPKAFRHYCVPLLETVCFKFEEVTILKQTWHDLSYSTFLVFTSLHVYQPVELRLSTSFVPATYLVYSQKGSYAILEEQSKQYFTKKEGTIYLRQNKTETSHCFIRFNHAGVYRMVFCFLSSERFAYLQKYYLSLSEPEILSGKKVFQAGNLVKRITEEMQLRNFQNVSEQDLFFEQGLLRIYRLFISMIANHDFNWRAMSGKQRIIQLKEFIENCLSEDLSIQNLATMLSLTPAGLRKSFKTYSGDTIFHYIKQVRIQRATEMLLQFPNRSIQKIAGEVGYASRQGFDKAFRLIMHCTPEDYRRLPNRKNR